MFISPEDFNFENSLGHLIGKLRNHLAGALDAELTALALSAAQAVALMRIAQQPNMPAATLCRLGGYDTGAMTRMLDKLEDKGLISRQRSSSDRRIVELELTAAGKAVCAVLPTHFCTIGNRIVGDFSEDEIKTLKHLLNRLLKNAEQLTATADTDNNKAAL